MNIDSYESLTSRIGRLRLKRCDSVPALTVFVAYAPTSDYDDEEVESFYVELKKFCEENHTFYKVIVGDFNAKIGLRRKNFTSEPTVWSGTSKAARVGIAGVLIRKTKSSGFYDSAVISDEKWTHYDNTTRKRQWLSPVSFRRQRRSLTFTEKVVEKYRSGAF
ncbi:unnamed protein product [Heligmosomoides polygyrus]|uniref:Endo/exonuclease/phosphatase domain-containing protein n=1 Tax=Heligmosomoides polygyrus TaxID=6339 RepID=A0A183G5M6_HELPZ|nr:unnamed protein product [Heligmosomoides polygyrus]